MIRGAPPPHQWNGCQLLFLCQGGYPFDRFTPFVGFQEADTFAASCVVCVHSVSVFDLLRSLDL